MADKSRARAKAVAGPRRKALLVGINRYPSQFPSLKGCVNDALMMGQLLVDEFDFETGEDMRMLVDERATKAAILERLDWLVADVRPGDILVFHYSGHGAQVPDRDGDEADKLDECLCPYDFSWDDPLTDDDLRERVERVPVGANFTVILDCCHSGTGLRATPGQTPMPSVARRLLAPPDIAFRAVKKVTIDANLVNRSVTMTEFRSLERNRFGRSLGDVGVLISGCKAEQESKDAWIQGDYHGALSYSLYEALKEGKGVSYSGWIERAVKLLRERYEISSQDPQLEGNDEIRRWQLFGVGPLTTRAPAAGGPRPIPRRRVLAYVHGISRHDPGYSTPWWSAMAPHVAEIYPHGDLAEYANGKLKSEGERHEVLWSDLVNSSRSLANAAATASRSADRAAAAASRRTARAGRGAARNAAAVIEAPPPSPADQAKAEILAVLEDRIERDEPKFGSRAPGCECHDEAESRALFTIPGLGGIDDFMRYWFDRQVRSAIQKRFLDVVATQLRDNVEIDLICHSWGTVVAYDALRMLDATVFRGVVRNFFTVGSALSMAPVRSRLAVQDAGRFKRPKLVGRWTNLAARGDVIGGRLIKHFEVDDDYSDLDATGCGFVAPVCAHGRPPVSR